MEWPDLVNIAQRPVRFARDHTINYDGVVFHKAKKLPTTSMQSRKDIRMLAVEINGTKHFIWRLLSSVWEGNKLLLPRNGNFMRWEESNRIILRTLSSSDIQDADDIHAIWKAYQCDGVHCHQISERTKLKYETNQYKRLIQDVFLASVR